MANWFGVIQLIVRSYGDMLKWFGMSPTEKYLSWILKGGLLLTPFLVFIVTRSLYFPFITGKNFAFRILIEILAVIWVYAALRYERFRPRFSWLGAAVVVFIAVMGLAVIFSLSPYRSFWSNFERMEGYIGLLHFLAYFLILGSVFAGERDWRIFFSTSLAASVAISFYAVLQLAGRLAIHQGGTRVDATLGNATYLAAYLLFHIFFLLWFLLRSRELWLRVGLGAVLAFELVILYFTATRGAILGLLGGFIVLGLLLALLERGTLRRIALAGLGIVVLIPAVFFFIRDTSLVKSSDVLIRFASISPSETTTQARFTIWNMALQGFKERPILGWGQENFIYVFSKYYDPSLWRQEPWFDRAHNVFLDWLTAGGVLGLLSYLAMFAAAGWLLVSALRARTIDAVTFGIFSSLLAAHFFQILFVFDNLTSYLLFFGVLAYVHSTAAGFASGAEIAASGGRSKPKAVSLRGLELPLGATVGVTALVAAGMILLLYFANIRPIMAAKSILDALRLNQVHEPAGKVDAMMLEFRQGLELRTFGTMELREQISQTSNFILRDSSIALQDKEKYIEFAIQELEAQRTAVPSDVRAKAFLSTLYVAGGRPADAIRVVDEALAISQRRQQFYFIAAEAYLNAGDNQRAVEVLSRAYDLAPDYPEAITNLAVVYILSGKDEEAELLFEKHFGTRVVAREQYAQAYLQIGRFDKAAEIWEVMAAANPNDARLHAALGVAYARSGRPQEGIREIEKAIELEPNFKSDGEMIIQSIRSGQIR